MRKGPPQGPPGSEQSARAAAGQGLGSQTCSLPPLRHRGTHRAGPLWSLVLTGAEHRGRGVSHRWCSVDGSCNQDDSQGSEGGIKGHVCPEDAPTRVAELLSELNTVPVRQQLHQHWLFLLGKL